MFQNIVKILEKKMNKQNLLKIASKIPFLQITA